MCIKIVLLIAFICGVFQWCLGQSECRKCLPSNGAYCVDEKSYHLCLDGKNPTTTELHQCNEGHVCTSTANICEPIIGPTNLKNQSVCGKSCDKKCPITTSVKKDYICLSRNQYGRCVNGDITTVDSCKSDSICSSEFYTRLGVICVPRCLAALYKVSATCDNKESISPPAVDIDGVQSHCEAAVVNHPNDMSFFIRNPNDDWCTTYILCQKIIDGIDATLFKCCSGYFDLSKGLCVTLMPDDCVAGSIEIENDYE